MIEEVKSVLVSVSNQTCGCTTTIVQLKKLVSCENDTFVELRYVIASFIVVVLHLKHQLVAMLQFKVDSPKLGTSIEKRKTFCCQRTEYR